MSRKCAELHKRHMNIQYELGSNEPSAKSEALRNFNEQVFFLLGIWLIFKDFQARERIRSPFPEISGSAANKVNDLDVNSTCPMLGKPSTRNLDFACKSSSFCVCIILTIAK